jgi:Fe-S cluster assembly protein SufD
MITLPTNRDENWRYANLRPLAKAQPDPVSPIATTAIDLPPSLPGFERWVYVDGRHVPALSTTHGNAAQPRDAREAGAAFASLLDEEIARAGIDFALSRINAARGNEVLQVARPGISPANVEVLFVASAGAAGGTSYPRLQIQAPRESRLNIVERHLSAGAADSVVNGAVDIAVGADAVVNHCRVQASADTASCFDTLTAHVAERAEYRLRTVTLGGLTSRSTVFIKLAGRGARCELTAASIAHGAQTHDVFAEIVHAAPETVTRELYRGIATGRGKLGFNGKIVVAEGAPGADSEQSLKTLLNGTGAEASVRPQLEIYTDRVRAVHGATTGKLDEQMLFYMLSRGLDRREAQALLQWAFIEDAVSRLDCGTLREEIEHLVAAQLHDVSTLDGLLKRP